MSNAHSPKFAPVAPLHMMVRMLEMGRDIIGDYHLLLAHDVLRNQLGWETWAKSLQGAFTEAHLYKPTIIIDSSVIELGSPLSMDKIIEAAEIVQANVIVLPDIIGAPEATNDLVREFFQKYESADPVQHILYSQFEYMFVPQGKSLQEYIRSLEFVRDIPMISWIGLPRDALQFEIKSRRELIDATEILCPGMRIHLLGMSDNLLDDVLSARHSPSVVGIDSAVPLRAGVKGIPFSLGNSNYGKRDDYWESTEVPDLALENMNYFRSLII